MKGCVSLSGDFSCIYVKVLKAFVIEYLEDWTFITDTVNLMNGESLRYTLNKKTKLRNEIYRKQQEILESFADDAPRTQKEYRQHYICYENAGIT